MKYSRQRNVARELAEIVYGGLHQLTLVSESCVVTWAPTTRERKARRGFDHAELIARHVGVHLGIRTVKLLRRTTSQVQTGKSREDRLVTPTFVGRGHPVAPTVIVVDDVMTTGSTFRRAAETLARDGYEQIICIAPSHRSKS